MNGSTIQVPESIVKKAVFSVSRERAPNLLAPATALVDNSKNKLHWRKKSEIVTSLERELNIQQHDQHPNQVYERKKKEN